MTQLLLIRHGQTDWNVEGRYTGQTDIPINAKGHADAARVAEELKENPPTLLFSSDLQRAYDTASYIAKACDLDIQTDERFREINQGIWEGMLFPDIKAQFQKELDKRDSDPLRVGAPDGENMGQVRDRVLAALREILGAHAGDGQRIALVAHGFINAIIRVYFERIPLEKTWDYFPGTTEVVVIENPTFLKD